MRCTVEVEQVIQQHNDVFECTVFGLSDNYFGEVVCCAVVVAYLVNQNSRTGAVSITTNDARSWCAEDWLAGYKRPRRMLVRSR
jgi:acyl-coenzyme A synthetase/AMP-(fatty) acid ligase